MWRSYPSTILLLASLASGCSNVDRTAQDEGELISGLSAVPAPEFARCWFETKGDDAAFTCKTTSKSPADPFVTRPSIMALGTLDSEAAILGGGHDFDLANGAPLVLGTMKRSQFPIVFRVTVRESTIEGVDVAFADRASAGDLVTVKVTAPEELSTDRPLVVKRRFDLWPVALVFADESLTLTATETYRATLTGALSQGFGLSTERAAKGTLRWFVAPASGVNPVSIFGAGSANAPESVVDRPGAYLVTKDGLRPASEAEIAADYPSGFPLR